jgi:hypothetical protein
VCNAIAFEEGVIFSVLFSSEEDVWLNFCHVRCLFSFYLCDFKVVRGVYFG